MGTFETIAVAAAVYLLAFIAHWTSRREEHEVGGDG